MHHFDTRRQIEIALDDGRRAPHTLHQNRVCAHQIFELHRVLAAKLDALHHVEALESGVVGAKHSELLYKPPKHKRYLLARFSGC